MAARRTATIRHAGPVVRNPMARLLNVRCGNAGCAVEISCVSRRVPSKTLYTRRPKHADRSGGA